MRPVAAVLFISIMVRSVCVCVFPNTMLKPQGAVLSPFVLFPQPTLSCCSERLARVLSSTHTYAHTHTHTHTYACMHFNTCLSKPQIIPCPCFTHKNHKSTHTPRRALPRLVSSHLLCLLLVLFQKHRRFTVLAPCYFSLLRSQSHAN